MRAECVVTEYIMVLIEVHVVNAQAAEAFLVHLFEDANLCAIHAKRSVCAAILSRLLRPG